MWLVGGVRGNLPRDVCRLPESVKHQLVARSEMLLTKRRKTQRGEAGRRVHGGVFMSPGWQGERMTASVFGGEWLHGNPFRSGHLGQIICSSVALIFCIPSFNLSDLIDSASRYCWRSAQTPYGPLPLSGRPFSHFYVLGFYGHTCNLLLRLHLGYWSYFCPCTDMEKNRGA